MPMGQSALVRCLVFDLDDTLYLERDYVASGFRAVDRFAQSLGLEGLGARSWELFERGVRGDTFDRVLRERGRDDAALALRMVEVYRAHVPEIRLLDDGVAALDRAHSSGARVALLTGGPVAVQRLKVTATGVERRVDLVVMSGQWGAKFDKPHERAFMEVQRRTGCRPSELTYIADNPDKDFAAPSLLGWSALRVRRPGSLHESLPTPDGVLEVLDLAGLIEN